MWFINCNQNEDTTMLEMWFLHKRGQEEMTDKQEDQLSDERFELEMEIFHQLDLLIEVSWDSDTVKAKIESAVKSRDEIMEELFKIWDKKDKDKHHD